MSMSNSILSKAFPLVEVSTGRTNSEALLAAPVLRDTSLLCDQRASDSHHSFSSDLSLTHTALPRVQTLFPKKWEAHCFTSSLGPLTGISNLTYSRLNLTILSRSLNEDCNVANLQVT